MRFRGIRLTNPISEYIRHRRAMQLAKLMFKLEMVRQMMPWTMTMFQHYAETKKQHEVNND